MVVRPPIPAPPYAGGCLCGAVRFSIVARPRAVNACHCLDCQKSSGTGAAVFLHCERADVTLQQGDLARYRKTAESGRAIDIARCATCGTRLWHEPVAMPTLMFVAAGTLDDARWAIPTSHIWTRTKWPDAVIAEDAIVCDGPASDRQILWDRFAEIYGAP